VRAAAPSLVAPALAALSADIARLTAELGRRVDVAALGATDRRGQLKLRAPGRFSANRACGLFRARDGWIAVNLARDEDRELIPAWLGSAPDADPWTALSCEAPGRTAADLIEGAILLGLPGGRVGEARADHLAPPALRIGAAGRRDRSGPLRVVDLSALWAGPLCGAVLAAMGAEVTKIESAGRPDPTRISAPDFFRRLNGCKAELRLDFGAAADLARLREAIATADVVITSARPRAFAGLGLEPAELFAANPALVWVAITAYGWSGDAGLRVGFGDDTAAAGGLVRWTSRGEPRFAGDALSDPVTGLAAALGALQALAAGGGLLVDAAMAKAAAAAAAMARLEAAA
jgi:crotonobetainyl-CoA:carnitine CoA-transferase CaiB-like acyl-CoA transferase